MLILYTRYTLDSLTANERQEVPLGLQQIPFTFVLMVQEF